MTVEGFLVAYGGGLILPLAVIEGPIVSVVTGLLSARGYFGWYWALGLLVLGDLIGDLACYWLGRSAGKPMNRVGRRFGINVAPSAELRERLAANTTKMLLVGKWTHSLGFFVLTGCGMLRVPLRRFMLVNLLATLPKSAALFGLGYFAAGSIPFLQRHVIPASVLLCLLGGLAILFIMKRPGAPRESKRPGAPGASKRPGAPRAGKCPGAPRAGES